MKVKNLIQSSKGIGLVEIMMAVAISGGLALTVAKLMDNSQQNVKQIEAKSENINLKGNIQTTLSDSTGCQNTFGTLITAGNMATLSASPTNSVTVPAIRNKANQIVYSTASTNVLPVTITAINLTNYNPPANTGDLVIQSTFRRSSTVVQVLKPLKIPINFNIDGTPALVACSVMAVGGGEWLLGGNAGTDPSSNYIGTSDNQPLVFKMNAISAGRIDSNGLFLGFQTGASNTGLYNTAVGAQSLYANTTGQRNVAFGYQAMNQNTTGSSNMAFGHKALINNTTGQQNIAIGPDSMGLNTTANWNIAIGSGSLYRNTTGTNNVAIGPSTQNYNTTGAENIAIGYAALFGNLDGSSNTIIGQSAGSSIRGGNHNVAVGWRSIHQSMSGTNDGAYNAALGSQSLINTKGGYNTAVGGNAGSYNSVGEYNTFLGYRTGAWASAMAGSRNIFIGAFAGNSASGAHSPGTTTDSDILMINNGVTSTPLIFGDFAVASRYLKFDGNLLVGTSNVSSNTNKNNLAVGNSNSLTTASGSAAIGFNNTVGGTASAAIGAFNNVSANYSIALGNYATATHSGSLVMGDNSTGVSSVSNNSFTARYSGGYRFYATSSGTTAYAFIPAGGNSWGSVSDRNAKHKIIPIDLEGHLRKIAKLPVFHWKYKGQDIPHMGPMAQDFYYIFRLGNGDDKHIISQDIEGVTLVAVKALEERTRKLQEENDELRTLIKDQEDRFEERMRILEARINKR